MGRGRSSVNGVAINGTVAHARVRSREYDIWQGIESIFVDEVMYVASSLRVRIASSIILRKIVDLISINRRHWAVERGGTGRRT